MPNESKDKKIRTKRMRMILFKKVCRKINQWVIRFLGTETHPIRYRTFWRPFSGRLWADLADYNLNRVGEYLRYII